MKRTDVSIPLWFHLLVVGQEVNVGSLVNFFPMPLWSLLAG